MADILTNKATIEYGNNTTSGIVTKNTAISVNSTSSTMTVQKTVSKPYFKPGDRLTYKIIITNSTDSSMGFGLITDTFSVTGQTYSDGLYTFVANSASFLINDAVSTAPLVTQEANGNLTISLGATVLPPYGTGIITYMMDIGSIYAGNDLINTISVTNTNVPAVTLTSGPLTILKEYALLSAVKKAPSFVAANATFNYTITISNTGNQPTSTVTITDTLPDVASITSIKTKIGTGSELTLPNDIDFYTFASDILTIKNNSDGATPDPNPIGFVIPATNGTLVITITAVAKP